MATKVKKRSIEKKPSLCRTVQKVKNEEAITPEVQDALERAEWQKEKHSYWSSRFRRVLADAAAKPKAKKVNAL